MMKQSNKTYLTVQTEQKQNEQQSTEIQSEATNVLRAEHEKETSASLVSYANVLSYKPFCVCALVGGGSQVGCGR